jgi:hypothetical protein
MDNKSGDGQWRPQYTQHPSEQTSRYDPRTAPSAASNFDASPVPNHSLYIHDDQHTGGYGVDREESRLRNDAHWNRLRSTDHDPSGLYPSSSSYRDASGSPWASSGQTEHDQVEGPSYTPQSSLFEHPPNIAPPMENPGHHESVSHFHTPGPRTEEHISPFQSSYAPDEAVDKERNGPWSAMNTRYDTYDAGIAPWTNRPAIAVMNVDAYEPRQDDPAQTTRSLRAISSCEYDLEHPKGTDDLEVLDHPYHGDGPSVSISSSLWDVPSAYTQDNRIKLSIAHEVPEGNRRENSRGQGNGEWQADRLDLPLR